MIREAIATYLLSCSAITDIIGTALHYERNPQGDTADHLTLQELDDIPYQTHQGESDLRRSRFQFDAWSRTNHTTAWNIAQALRNCLSGFRGPMGSFAEVQCESQGRNAIPSLPDEGDQGGWHRESTDYIVHFRTAKPDVRGD